MGRKNAKNYRFLPICRKVLAERKLLLIYPLQPRWPPTSRHQEHTNRCTPSKVMASRKVSARQNFLNYYNQALNKQACAKYTFALLSTPLLFILWLFHSIVGVRRIKTGPRPFVVVVVHSVSPTVFFSNTISSHIHFVNSCIQQFNRTNKIFAIFALSKL